MKMHIKDFAKLTGVSVRTLHYYDEIELLKPASVDEQNGYRFYDEKCLEKMQQILFYRELDFSLKDINMILSSPDYDKQNALKQQMSLLKLKKECLERLIDAINSAMKGEKISMKTFDNTEFETKREEFAKEAKEKWGNTEAYKESAEKTNNYSKEKWNEVNSAMDSIIAEFTKCKNDGFTPDSSKAQELVEKWQNFITENHYTCTKEILAGLGEMYTADERFQANIDRHSSRTAQFMCDSIKVFCR